MKIAIMQPYIFPYIGYFQLVNAVDTFVFYDDVNFIKGGWINRNTILVNNSPFTFSIALEKMSSFNLISETKIDLKKYENFKKKFYKTIEQSYRKAPFFEETYDLIQDVLEIRNINVISNLAINSINTVSDYLSLNTKRKVSSKSLKSTRGLNSTDRLISIVKYEGSKCYINSTGGKKLYNKGVFEEQGVQLKFLKPQDIYYKQFNDQFLPNLSIIDVLMFNSKSQIRDLLSKYELE